MKTYLPDFADALRDSEHTSRERLSSQDLDRMFEAGRKWRLGPLLASGGSALFPHASLPQCGHQVASVVEGCLDCGADQILALGVLHPLTDAIWKARQRVWKGGDPTVEPLRGIHAAGGTQETLVLGEYSLLSFEFLLKEAAKRRGIAPPRLIMCYPFLAAGHPETLPGIEELEAIASDSAVVITGDLVHHGRAYATPAEECVPLGPEATAHATDLITKEFASLASGDYTGYFMASREFKSDASAGGQVLRHLLGPLDFEISEVIVCDTESIYSGLSPSWVAAALVQLQRR